MVKYARYSNLISCFVPTADLLNSSKDLQGDRKEFSNEQTVISIWNLLNVEELFGEVKLLENLLDIWALKIHLIESGVNILVYHHYKLVIFHFIVI